MTKGNNRSGFTLVELAIVLVIIGLIVGGVLVGQDLIKAATVRAAVTQLERYDTAANTFRNKYNALPGDLQTPNTFFTGYTNTGGNGTGDGDGLIEGISAATGTAGTTCTTTTCISGEAALFWTELNEAGLSPEAITTRNATNVTLTPADTVLPQSKLGRGARVAVHSFSGRNYYLLLNPGTTALTAGTATFTAAVAPIDALQIDTKMDDAVPSTGKVISVAPATGLATTAANGAAAAAVSASTCFVSDSTPPTYATTSYNSNTNTDLIVCALSVRTSF